MLQVIQPTYELRIGIKDGKICGLHWGQEIYLHEGELSITQLKKRLKKYFRLAIKSVDEIKK